MRTNHILLCKHHCCVIYSHHLLYFDSVASILYLLYTKGNSAEDYIEKTRDVCSDKCKPIKWGEMKRQDDGCSGILSLDIKQPDEGEVGGEMYYVFLSVRSSKAHASRDHIFSSFFHIFHLRSFMNCGAS